MYDDIGLYSVVRRLRGNRHQLPRDAAHPPGAGRGPSGPGHPLFEALLAVVRARFVKSLLLPLDLALFLFTRSRVMQSHTDVLVMDRYFYDSLVELQAETVWWGRLFLALLPSPEISVFVDVDPAVAFARKGEYDVPELSRREHAYRLLFDRLQHSVVIRNDSLKAAKEQLLRTVFDRLKGRV
jgi:hypothetical protein